MGAKFIPNPNLERELQAMIQERVQEPANDALRAEIRQVNAEMAGQPAEQVYDELVRRLSAVFPAGFTPDEEKLREVAEAIEARTLED